MKIQCDVCSRDEASVFCCADEAALCAACDRRVHLANKLSLKHHRFSFSNSTTSEEEEQQPLPLCDVCQERRAFFFCQQDRAILCRDCDLAIHSDNPHTKNHSRFLLTGVMLSPTPITNANSASDSSSSTVNPHAETVIDPPETETETVNCATMSEYLIDMLPGWHVEDLLDFPSYNGPYGFCENEDDSCRFLDTDVETTFGTEGFEIWGPTEVPPPPTRVPQYLPQTGGAQQGERIKDSKNSSSSSSSSLRIHRRRGEHVLTVPQIIPPSTGSTNRSNNSVFF